MIMLWWEALPPHCHRQPTILPGNSRFARRQFRHNSCGDANRSSISEETYVPKRRSHSPGRIPSIPSLNLAQLRTDAAISSGESRINVNLGLRVMKISQNEVAHVPHVSQVRRSPCSSGGCTDARTGASAFPSANPGRIQADEWSCRGESSLRIPQGGDSPASLTVPEQGRREQSRTVDSPAEHKGRS